MAVSWLSLARQDEALDSPLEIGKTLTLRFIPPASADRDVGRNARLWSISDIMVAVLEA
jgi:hypothetical protein